MIHCKNCIHWVDESLEQIEAEPEAANRLFMGCRIFGYIQNEEDIQNCTHYVASENLFTICSSCHLTVPKLCVSLGECANCTDTDLFCVDSCIGDENRKYCSHFVRLNTEGVHLIDKDQVFDLFPVLEMPGQGKRAVSSAGSNGSHSEDKSAKLPAFKAKPSPRESED
jgi:hypothetical protein